MKRCFIAFCLLLLTMTIHAKAIREEINLAEEKARISYAFGMTVGGDLQQAGLDMDYAAFTEGLKAAMEQENMRIGREEAIEIVQNAFERAMDRQAAELREKEISFLLENAAHDYITITESGLQYMVLEEGNGPKPSAGDTVLVHYEGALINGTVFDSSYEMDEPEVIPLYMVFPSLAEGIQLMNVGSRYRIYIPSHLAYGERGLGQFIPPYSTLVFTIELIDIIEEPEEE